MILHFMKSRETCGLNNFLSDLGGVTGFRHKAYLEGYSTLDSIFALIRSNHRLMQLSPCAPDDWFKPDFHDGAERRLSRNVGLRIR